jgi:hypothetical protein
MRLTALDGLIVYGDGGITFRHSGNPVAVRAQIRAFTNSLLNMDGEKREFEVKHTFLNGVYMRELFIPKDSILVGKIHRMDCINIVSRGDISILTEFGANRVGAGYTGVSPAGIQKIGFAHENTVFVNVFRTDETDLEKIEDVVAFDSYEAFDRLTAQSELLIIEGA